MTDDKGHRTAVADLVMTNDCPYGHASTVAELIIPAGSSISPPLLPASLWTSSLQPAAWQNLAVEVKTSMMNPTAKPQRWMPLTSQFSLILFLLV